MVNIKSNPQFHEAEKKKKKTKELFEVEGFLTNFFIIRNELQEDIFAIHFMNLKSIAPLDQMYLLPVRVLGTLAEKYKKIFSFEKHGKSVSSIVVTI